MERVELYPMGFGFELLAIEPASVAERVGAIKTAVVRL
jgi:predicted ATPase